ncbi:VOC family protein [Paraglaciecola polaris]|uniref:Glyoxalase/bleomycin resistance protein/dioxygenase n=1 Tax=Paraglaciecola polaris LMG 21857 TaxID=1129793 RepID=K6ZEN9_9ALTE|nr:VOC family protein [Paraglaciecola polaris]GAC34556.1 glyoxalase/bleomycin resistance protein/dioxygenase [Paraglaciecola polaris LMG 21857]
MKISSSLFAILLCALPSLYATAAPVNEEQRISVDIRRTTFLVNDIDTSLQLYRDALGLNVIYDQMINSPMENGETRKRRLVLLQANDTFIGALGLLQYIYPEKPQRQEKFDEPVPGDPIMVMNVADLDIRWKRVEKAPKVAVIEAPHHVEYPRADGGKIAVMVSMIRDPDGYWLEVNQLLDAPAKASD